MRIDPQTLDTPRHKEELPTTQPGTGLSPGTFQELFHDATNGDPDVDVAAAGLAWLSG
jgi:hypothetical protein